MKRSATAFWLFLAYAVFVVYGSLVPLEFRALPLDVAWQRFQHIPFLQLGITSRADWVANGVLYVPLAFFGARALAVAGFPVTGAAALSCVFGCVLAVAVEFTQLWFPQRTVSQNDILAECIGSAIGAFAAPFFAGWIDRLAAAWRVGGTRLLPHLLEAYAASYVLLSFFPYDLLLSSAEIADKWHGHGWGWLFAPNERGMFLVLLQWCVELVLVMPIGALGVFRRPVVAGTGSGAVRVAAALLAGALLGLFIEVGQFFVESAVSQGASVLSRALGVAAGAWLLRWLHDAGWAGVRATLRPLAPWLWLPYLLLVAAVDGFFRLRWHGARRALESLQATHWLPFYYHYFTTEALALYSLTSVALMYLPVALLVWARGGSARHAALIAAVLASVAEVAKLFFAGSHADPTNVLVAAAASALAMGLLALAQRPSDTVHGAAATPDDAPSAGTVAPRPWLLALPLAAIAALLFPVFPLLLLGVLGGCAAAVWRWPVLALALIPAALPVLDWAPWSGRFFFDEFDLLQGVCLAVALQRTRAAPRSPAALGLRLAFIGLAVSLVVSALRALVAMPALGDTAFSSYYSGYNALRIVKGAAWAWAFGIVWRRLHGKGARRVQALAGGMALGLALTIGFVLWERAVFASLLDFGTDFRVTGPFSAMHKGGAYIECYLAVAAAFAIASVLRPGPAVRRVGALMLLAGAGYAMLVTYSRNGYAALAVVLLASLLAAFLPAWRARPAQGAQASGEGRRGGVQALYALALLGVLAVIAIPLGSGYARQRLAKSGQDLAVRQAHWVDGLALRDGSLATTLIGMGVGRFPERHFWGSREPVHAAAYSLVRDGDAHLLRLAQGATLYIEQIVPTPAVGALTLSFDWRAAPGQAAPTAVLCEKWTLTSLHCAAAAVAPPASSPGSAPAATTPAAAMTAAATSPPWQHADVALDATRLLAAARPWHAPFKLALQTPQQGAFEITRVSLRSALGEELLHNGDFAQGMDRWFFATDIDPPWHLHSVPVAVLFDQGWLGVLAWSALALMVLLRGSLLLWRGQALVPAALPAALGFAVSGTLNTLIDAPRFLWLLLLLMGLAAASTEVAAAVPSGAAGQRSRRRRAR